MPDSTEPIPEYQSALAAYHEAFAPELRARVDALPIEPGDRVLDLACGDGVYSRWLSRRVGPKGMVVAFDLLKSYLDLARETVEEDGGGAPGRVAYVSGDVHEPPLSAGSFDLVWCAQSLRSLPDPSAALRVMAGLTRPGGVVAVLENDAMHQVLLPWPEDLELALRRAELEVLTDAPGPTSKHYIGRWLPRLFAETGLTSVRLSTRAADRHAPLSEAERLYLASYLEGLVERLAGHLPADARAELAAHCTPGSPRYLPDQPDLAFTCIDQVVTGVRPGGG